MSLEILKKEFVDYLNHPDTLNPKILKLNGDASTRVYYRIFDKKKSYIFCYDKMLNGIEYDFLVINRLLKENGINVPEIFDVDFDNKFIIQEDLGNEYLSFYVGNSSLNKEYSYYSKTLGELLKIQKINKTSLKDLECGKRFFDGKKYLEEIDITTRNFQKFYGEKKFNPDFFNSVHDYFNKILKDVSLLHECLCHRDFHSRNIMFYKKRFFLIDYQDARIGSIVYDLASLLEDPYNSIDILTKKKLLKKYWEMAKSEAIIDYNYEQFISFYDIVATQRLYKALGTYLRMWNEKGKNAYLPYVGLTIEKMKTISSKNNLLSNLPTLILKYYYEN